MSTFLLDLSFFTNAAGQANDKSLQKVIQGDIVCTTSGGGFLFISDSNQYIYKLDHHIEAQMITTPLPSICYLQASQSSQEILAASNNGNTYSIVIANISDFSENTPNFSFYQASSFDLPVKTKSTESATFFCTSPSLTYIAFSTGPNEIQIFKAPHSIKSKPMIYNFSESGITNMFITESGLLYITTVKNIVVYDVNLKTTTTLDSVGCSPKFAFMFNNDHFAICRDKTITFYNQDRTKETLDSSEGNEGPESVGGVGPYFYATYPCNIQGSNQRIKVIDPVYKVLASQQNMKDATFVHMQWGALVIILKDKNVLMYSEVPEQAKVDRFCKKNRFEQALKMARELNLGEAAVANIHKLQGDHFYSLANFDQAIDQYIQTLGFTEPSHVIQKFVEPHHAENLMKYLIALQEKKLATKQHTTLLFNCYTKIRATNRLDNAVAEFIEAAKRDEAPSFDVETAVDVLKRNGYQKYAEDLAKAYRKHRLYIQLLYENQKYGEILSYMQTLPGQLVRSLLTDYGSEIMDNYPEGSSELTQFCVKCCTVGIPNMKRGDVTKIEPDTLAMIFMNNDSKHFDFLYQIFQTNPDDLSELIWNVLIEMALRAQSPKVMELLKYPNAKYSNEQALVYLTAFNHTEGKKMIYEKMGLYTLILQEAEPEDCLEICAKYGHEDRTLWSDALVKLSQSKCDPKILASFLEEVQKQDALPFLTILKVLKNAGNHTFKTILPIVQATFKREQDLLHAAEQKIKECNERAAANKEVVQTLSTKNFVINQSKCARCKTEIDTESNHFMCGHSFHMTCLGDSETFCPLCRNRYEEIIEKKINRMTAARDQSSIKQKLDEAGDGFQFLLQQVGASLFASGVDLMSSTQDDEKINEAKELLRKMSP
ncbi:hypothetical protein TRFO_36015 [Tritrichomonas foetus]|uniref:RING-type domain-containing protein n=1 Tax=Tritrichomonas foetus TaxID=1144522 RepID=A0A1J4JEV4_9EUKA|nr:hypothetical protein TRFO_36015 [Tritrichomonas foetus]|eukprot:OHS97726.1 hypothetical protein TRFO_36015 [Tritrichomonas foetus]